MRKWVNEFPSEPGNYWFYGELWRGSMGCHYGDNPDQIKPELCYVQIKKGGGGSLMGSSQGQFVFSKKFNFNKNQQGWIGYWRKVESVELPEDYLKLFNHETNKT